MTLIPANSGCAVRNAFAPASSFAVTASSFASSAAYVPGGTSPSSTTLVVPSTGRSTSTGPVSSSSQPSSSLVVEHGPPGDSSISDSTTCTLLIVIEFGPVPMMMSARTPGAIGWDPVSDDFVVTERLTGRVDPMSLQDPSINAMGANQSAPDGTIERAIHTSRERRNADAVLPPGRTLGQAACRQHCREAVEQAIAQERLAP